MSRGDDHGSGRASLSPDPRRIAYDILYEVTERGGYIDRVSEAVFAGDGAACNARDRAFILRLVRGTAERLIELDAVIDRYAKPPVRHQKRSIRNILRLAVYQIIYMDSVPERAAVNEAVAMIKAIGPAKLSGFVNAVLRSFIREISGTPYEKLLNDICRDAAHHYRSVAEILHPEPSRVKELSVRYSMPVQIADMWIGRFGEGRAEEIMASFLTQKPLTLRVNEDRIETAQLARLIEARLEKDAAEREASGAPDTAATGAYESGWGEVDTERGIIIIRRAIDPVSLPGYDEGYFYVQDIAAMSAVDSAGILPGDMVLDVCAAPGGKSIQAAMLAGVDGRVVACDVSESRARTIAGNVRRMRIDTIDIHIRDAAEDIPYEHDVYDVVLADLPCSGLGVLSGKPESKYRYGREAVSELTAQSRRILDTVCAYVRPGGRLVFSTCTINEAENESVTAAFLGAHPDYSWIAEEQLLPVAGRQDGFYYALMQRSV